MKSLFLLAVAAAPMLLTSCVVERDVYRPHRHPYHPYRRDVVVVSPGAPRIVYYNDARGRYYWRDHRRVYVRY